MLTLLKRGRLAMPPGADPGLFIKSGGAMAAKPAPASPEAKPVTLRQLFDSYENEVAKDPKTMRTIRIHQEHVARILGAGTAVEAIKLVEVQKYCDLRSKETWHAS